MGYLRRGKWMRDENLVRGRGERVWKYRSAIDVLRFIRRVVTLVSH